MKPTTNPRPSKREDRKNWGQQTGSHVGFFGTNVLIDHEGLFREAHYIVYIPGIALRIHVHSRTENLYSAV